MFAGGPARSSCEVPAVWRWGRSQGAGSSGLLMKVWPFGVALRGEASNRLMLRRLNAVRGERSGKGAREAPGGDHEGERE